jgi:hypothetical protein
MSRVVPNSSKCFCILQTAILAPAIGIRGAARSSSSLIPIARLSSNHTTIRWSRGTCPDTYTDTRMRCGDTKKALVAPTPHDASGHVQLLSGPALVTGGFSVRTAVGAVAAPRRFRHSYAPRHSRLSAVQLQHVRNCKGFGISQGCLRPRRRRPCAMPFTCRRTVRNCKPRYSLIRAPTAVPAIRTT